MKSIQIKQKFKDLFNLYNSFQKTVTSHWNTQYEQRLSTEYVIRDWTESKYVLNNYIHPLISTNPHEGWLEWFINNFLPNKPYERGLDLGCGSGAIETLAFQLDLFKRIDGFDISKTAISQAKNQSHTYGYSHKVRYKCQDLASVELPREAYDTVFMSMTLHHVLELEAVLQKIKDGKKKDGYFVLHEYIGENRFQWTDAQIEHGNRLLNLLPDELRVDCGTNEVRKTFDKPPLSLMVKLDPSEAIRSADIMGLVSVYFDIVNRRDYGGTILQPLLGNIIHNFKPEQVPEHAELLNLLFEEEQKLIRDGILQSNFTVLVLK